MHWSKSSVYLSKIWIEPTSTRLQHELLLLGTSHSLLHAYKMSIECYLRISLLCCKFKGHCDPSSGDYCNIDFFQPTTLPKENRLHKAIWRHKSFWRILSITSKTFTIIPPNLRGKIAFFRILWNQLQLSTTPPKNWSIKSGLFRTWKVRNA